MGDLTAAEQSYLDFDWAASEEWKEYCENLYPTPAANKLGKFKKKWYNRHVDTSFPVDSKVGETPTQSAPTTNGAAARGKVSAQPRTATTAPPPSGVGAFQIAFGVIQMIGAAMGIIFYLPFAPRSFLHLSIVCFVIGFCGDIIFKFGSPKLDPAYLSGIIAAEEGQGLAMTAAAVSMRGASLALVSPCITALLNAGQLWDGVKHRLPLLIANNAKIKNIADSVNQGRYSVMQARANLELTIPLGGVILYFFKRGPPLLSLFLYFNILRMKYKVNGFSRTSFARLHASILALVTQPGVPPIIAKGYTTMSEYILRFALQ